VDRGNTLLRKLNIIILITIVLCTAFTSQVVAFELSGYVAGQGRYFFNEPLYPGQEKDNASIAMLQEYYHEWQGGSSVIFAPFIRIDNADSERTHFDIRELNFLWLTDYAELRVGVGKVFWGVTEFYHLVDIINQTDLVEHIDAEEKLGQPMVQLTVPGRFGVLQLFVLPYFRERTFPGEKGRLRGPLPVDVDNAEYESSEKEHHVDYAVRYSHTIGDWDFGIYHFTGTGREPTLELRFDQYGRPRLIPFYEQIDQTGLDLQTVAGSWLFKLESLYRSGQRDQDFFASTGGFEYSFVNIAASGIDIGLIGEYAYDERAEDATNPFDNDVMIGTRIALNDAASTEILLGFSQDIDSEGQIFTLESSRRIGDTVKVSLEAFMVFDASEEDYVYSLRDDDYVLLDVAYYF
jgi:hypothetical protein